MNPPNASLLGLPRELRDKIYDYALIHKRHVRGPEDSQASYDFNVKTKAANLMRMKVRDTGNLSLLLVCHQVNEEYRSRFHTRSTLILVQREQSNFKDPPIPQALWYVSQVELHIYLDLQQAVPPGRVWSAIEVFRSYCQSLSMDLWDLKHLDVCLYYFVDCNVPTRANDIKEYSQKVFEIAPVTYLTGYMCEFQFNPYQCTFKDGEIARLLDINSKGCFQWAEWAEGMTHAFGPAQRLPADSRYKYRDLKDEDRNIGFE